MLRRLFGALGRITSRIPPRILEGLTVVAVALISLAFSVLVFGSFQYNDVVEISSIKLRFDARGELDPDPRIRLIAIDDNSINELKNAGVHYPFPRALQGKLLKRLADRGARAVCFDLLFDSYSAYGPEDDQAFKDAIEYAHSKGTDVILSAAIPVSSATGYEQATLLTPNETLMSAPITIGLANTSIRAGERGKGAYRDKERAVIRLLDKTYYSQAAEMYRVYLQDTGKLFTPEDNNVDRYGSMYVNYFNGRKKHIAAIQYLQLFPEVVDGVNPLTGEKSGAGDTEWETGKTAERLGLGKDSGWDEEGADSGSATSADTGAVSETSPGDSGGTGTASTGETAPDAGTSAETALPGAEALSVDSGGGVAAGTEKPATVGKEAKKEKKKTRTTIRVSDIKGKFVFVGTFSEADNDFFSTPFSDKMAGVETNANAFQTFLTKKHIHPVPVWITVFILVAGSLIAGYIAYYLQPRWLSVLAAFLFISLVLAVIVLGFVFFRLLFVFTFTAFSYPVSYTAVLTLKLASEEREKAKIRRTFGRYVSEAVVEEIINNPEFGEMSGIDRQVAVLFSDIRNFSTISEAMSPRDVLAFLNEYFDSMSPVFDAHGGYVDKFMGDGIMAIFGAPVPTENPSLDAVTCGLEMVQKLKEYVHPRLRALGVPEFKIGIGVHYGSVIMGNIGSSRRSDYSIIGDAVNLASRLESATKEYGTAIIVSEEVVARIGDALPSQHIATIRVKGRAKEEKLYAIYHPADKSLTDL